MSVSLGLAMGAVADAGRGMLSALAIVSGQDDVTHPDVRARLDPQVAGMVAAIEADPGGYEART